METHGYISINPAVRRGKPCVAGTSLTVSDVLACLADGSTVEQLILDFPQLSSESINACIAYTPEEAGLR